MASKRTLVKVTAGESCIGFQTVSRERGSSRHFLIVREHLERLVDERAVIVSDLHSFAELRYREDTGMLIIDFTWLSCGCGSDVSGWEERVILPYEALMAFVRDSAQGGGPEEWRHLSVVTTFPPKLVFHDQERLRECVANRWSARSCPTPCGITSDTRAWSGSSSITILRRIPSCSARSTMTVSARWAGSSSITTRMI